ncbi:hypothetical protein ACHAXS_005230 [Conticribra weissflogii]
MMAHLHELTLNPSSQPSTANHSMQNSSDDNSLDDSKHTLLLNDIISPSARIAHLDWSKFCIFKSKKNIPKMMPKCVLGGFDKNGRPTKKPIYSFGPV